MENGSQNSKEWHMIIYWVLMGIGLAFPLVMLAVVLFFKRLKSRFAIREGIILYAYLQVHI